MTLQSESLTSQTVRFVTSKGSNITTALAKCHNKKVRSLLVLIDSKKLFQVHASRLLRRTNLHGEKSSRATLLLEFENNHTYNPGDHLGVYAENRPELVDKIIKRLKGVEDPDTPIELQMLKETHTSNGVMKTWTPHERLPSCSLRTLLSRFMDITTPPTPHLLQHFASIATEQEDQRKLELLATVSTMSEVTLSFNGRYRIPPLTKTGATGAIPIFSKFWRNSRQSLPTLLF